MKFIFAILVSQALAGEIQLNYLQSASTSPQFNNWWERRAQVVLPPIGRAIDHLELTIGKIDLTAEFDDEQTDSINGMADPIRGKLWLSFGASSEKDKNIQKKIGESLSHEIGHLVCDAYWEKHHSSVIKIYHRLSKKGIDEKMLVPPESSMTHAIEKSYLPINEFCADLFRVVVMKESGKHSPRDFSNPKLAKLSDQYEHSVFNPMRAHLWKETLSKCLSDEKALFELFDSFAAILMAQLEHYGLKAMEDVQLQKPLTIISREKFNSDFYELNKIRKKMSCEETGGSK